MKYYIVRNWWGTGAMVLDKAGKQLWNMFGHKPGTLFKTRQDAQNAIKRTITARKKEKIFGHKIAMEEQGEIYRIQTVEVKTR